MPRNTSHTALKKNLSHGKLAALGGVKHGHATKHSKHDGKPEPQRRDSASKKSKQKSAPPPESKHPSVHFDVGDEDEEDEMEENNTRQNSVILDPERHPHNRPEEKPPDATESEPLSPPDKQPPADTARKDFATVASPTTQPSSYRQHQHTHPPDADAIAQRLLERTPAYDAPKASSPMIKATLSNPRSPVKPAQESASGTTTTANTPMVSEFINNEGFESKDGTPQQLAQLNHTRSASTNVANEQSNLTMAQRNRSAPNFASPASPSASSETGSGIVSGATTPGGAPSRTQQKLWLQRGLSQIEAMAQQYSPGAKYMGATVFRLRGDWTRWTRKRLKRLNTMQAPKVGIAGDGRPASGASPTKPTTPGGQKQRNGKSHETDRGNAANARKPRVSFAMTPDEDAETPEQNETALEIARRLWERQEISVGE
ncbi:hypothetical protein H2203_007903 [Taxawa tesnikishii (nom. ined.)]|nr:hypothetical protein H2203_007903 [Dothideales sp. JES 119]